MDGKETVKYVTFYQLFAAVAALVGFALVGLGVMVGFGDSIEIVLREAPQDWGDAVAAAEPVLFAVLAVIGVLVWQLGKTVALVVTMQKVADESSGAGADADRLRSEVLEHVDDRVADVEAELEQHEQRLSDAPGDAASAADGSPGNRRSRRRGSAATGDGATKSDPGATTDGSTRAGGVTGTDGESGGDGAAGGSNRRGNRRAAGSDSDGGAADDADGSAN